MKYNLKMNKNPITSNQEDTLAKPSLSNQLLARKLLLNGLKKNMYIAWQSCPLKSSQPELQDWFQTEIAQSIE